MNPLYVADKLQSFGFWYTLWTLRDEYYTWTDSLWLIWIAHNYLRHREKLYDEVMR